MTRFSVSLIFLAMTDVPSQTLRNIVHICASTPARLKMVSSLFNWVAASPDAPLLQRAIFQAIEEVGAAPQDYILEYPVQRGPTLHWQIHGG
ncbi:MAG: hypothetical protein M1118_12040 [Chloroflexi bacterium]|nr:hypothetical protein [Chloroflexota bacterium]